MHTTYGINSIIGWEQIWQSSWPFQKTLSFMLLGNQIILLGISRSSGFEYKSAKTGTRLSLSIFTYASHYAIIDDYACPITDFLSMVDVIAAPPMEVCDSQNSIYTV